jgi:Zn-dependent protease
MGRQNDMIKEDIAWFFVLVMIMFVFVVMHEYGHALTARKFGVLTRDIIISPIGGIARLESMPRIAKHELLIALAGPAVNVLLSIIFGATLFLLGAEFFASSERINPVSEPLTFISFLLSINLALVVFNMIPAFPMDGGRVLRSLLSMGMDNHLNATKWASWIGQAFAALFIATGFYFDHFVLMLIGIFVFSTARREYSDVLLESKMDKTTAKELMNSDYSLLSQQDSLDKIIQLKEHNCFLVGDEDHRIIGVIPGVFVSDIRKNKENSIPLSEYISQSYGYISQQMTIRSIFYSMNEYGWSVAIVVDGNSAIMGIIDREMVKKFISG